MEVRLLRHVVVRRAPLDVYASRGHVVQTPRQHHHHRLGKKDAAYWVLTGFLNPILDGCRFWRGMEWVVSAVFRIRKP
jgi:TMEM189-like protein